MGKTTLRITVTIHENGSLTVVIEWICSNLSAGFELATPPRWGLIPVDTNCFENGLRAQAILCTRVVSPGSAVV